MKRSLLWVLSVLVLSFFSVSAASAAPTPIPTLVAPAEDTVVTTSLPVITGLAHSNLIVAVYIDDVFNGYATTVSSANGVSSFAYEPFLPLTPGEHTVMVRAEDSDAGTRSKKSDVRTFSVAHQLPAPTVLDAVVNNNEPATRPYIVGVAPSGTKVRVSIDGVTVGTTTATDHSSGTGSFSIRPGFDLSEGKHWVRATATEPSGLQRSSATAGPTAIWVTAPATTATETTSDTTDEQTETTTEEQNSTAETNASAEDTAVETEEVMTDESTEGMAVDAGTDETDEGNLSEADDGKETESTEAESGASTEDGTEDDEEDEVADTDEEDSNFEFLGWAALLVVAATVVARARRRRSGDVTDVTFSPSNDSKDSGDGKGDKTGQLDLKAPKENKNITVIKHDSDSSNDSSTKND